MQPMRLEPVTIDSPLERALSRRTLLHGVAAGGFEAGFGGSMLRIAPQVAAQEGTPEAAVETSQPGAAHRFRVGQIDVVVCDDGSFAGPGALFAVNAPDAALAEALAAQGLAPTDPISLAIHPLLVETNGRRVLLDTGVGALGPTPGNLLAALRGEGIAPEEIDVVLITHMHADHFGGARDPTGALVFPNARHLINAVEYEFWSAEPSLDELVVPDELKQQFRQTAKDTLTALQGTLEQIAPGDEIAPGVTAVDARGHTPGHLAVEVASDGETLLHIVDAAHLPEFHLAHPEWFLAADNWPAWTATTRKALFDRAAAENLLVATYHFPFPGVGRVTQDETGWVWTDEA